MLRAGTLHTPQTPVTAPFSPQASFNRSMLSAHAQTLNLPEPTLVKGTLYGKENIKKDAEGNLMYKTETLGDGTKAQIPDYEETQMPFFRIESGKILTDQYGREYAHIAEEKQEKSGYQGTKTVRVKDDNDASGVKTQTLEYWKDIQTVADLDKPVLYFADQFYAVNEQPAPHFNFTFSDGHLVDLSRVDAKAIEHIGKLNNVLQELGVKLHSTQYSKGSVLVGFQDDRKALSAALKETRNSIPGSMPLLKRIAGIVENRVGDLAVANYGNTKGSSTNNAAAMDAAQQTVTSFMKLYAKAMQTPDTDLPVSSRGYASLTQELDKIDGQATKKLINANHAEALNDLKEMSALFGRMDGAEFRPVGHEENYQVNKAQQAWPASPVSGYSDAGMSGITAAMQRVNLHPQMAEKRQANNGLMYTVSNQNRSFHNNARVDWRTATPKLMKDLLKGESPTSLLNGFRALNSEVNPLYQRLKALTQHLETSARDMSVRNPTIGKLNQGEAQREIENLKLTEQTLLNANIVIDHLITTGKGDLEQSYMAGGQMVYPHQKINEIVADNVKDSKFKTKKKNEDEEARHDMKAMNDLLSGYIANVVDKTTVY
jgi:hypothetical protein